MSKRVVEIWCDDSINQIGFDICHQDAMRILSGAKFDVLGLTDYLIYNLKNSKFQIGTCSGSQLWATLDLSEDKASSLEEFAKIAEVFCERKAGDIKVLTYSRAYADIEAIMRESARTYVHPRYNPGSPRKGEFDGKIIKVVPPVKTINEIQGERTHRLIRTQNQYTPDKMRFKAWLTR